MKRCVTGPLIALLAITIGARPASQPATRPGDTGPETLDGVLLNFREPIDVRPTRVSVTDAVQAIRDRCRVRIDVDWAGLHAIGIERDARVLVLFRAVKVRRALKMICNYFDDGETGERSIYLIPSDDDRSVVLANIAGFKASAVDRDYPVDDLIHPIQPQLVAPPAPAEPSLPSSLNDYAIMPEPKDELIGYIKESVDPSSWRDAGGALGEVSIGGDKATLHVHQTPANQRAVEAALAQYREHKRTIEAADAQFLKKHQLAATEPSTRP